MLARVSRSGEGADDGSAIRSRCRGDRRRRCRDRRGAAPARRGPGLGACARGTRPGRRARSHDRAGRIPARSRGRMAAFGRSQSALADRPKSWLFGPSAAAGMDDAFALQRRDPRGRGGLDRHPRGAIPGAPKGRRGTGGPPAREPGRAGRTVEPAARRDEHLGERRRARPGLDQGQCPLRGQRDQLAAARGLWPALRSAHRRAAGGAASRGGSGRPSRRGDPARNGARHRHRAARHRYRADLDHRRRDHPLRPAAPRQARGGGRPAARGRRQALHFPGRPASRDRARYLPRRLDHARGKR